MTTELEAQRAAYVEARAGYALSQGNSWVDFHTGFENGWDAARAPRVVSTVAELDALPPGSVVLDSEPSVMYRNHEDGWWWVPGTQVRFKSEHAALPATVLWVGGTE